MHYRGNRLSLLVCLKISDRDPWPRLRPEGKTASPQRDFWLVFWNHARRWLQIARLFDDRAGDLTAQGKLTTRIDSNRNKGSLLHWMVLNDTIPTQGGA